MNDFVEAEATPHCFIYFLGALFFGRSFFLFSRTDPPDVRAAAYGKEQGGLFTLVADRRAKSIVFL